MPLVSMRQLLDHAADHEYGLPAFNVNNLEQSVDRDQVLQAAEDLLLEKGLAQRGDLVVLTIGEPMGKSGGTNTMKIVKVGEHRS